MAEMWGLGDAAIHSPSSDSWQTSWQFRIHTLFHMMLDSFQLHAWSCKSTQSEKPYVHTIKIAQMELLLFHTMSMQIQDLPNNFCVYKLDNIALNLGTLTFLGWSYTKVSLTSSSACPGNNWKKLFGFPNPWSGILKRSQRQPLMLCRKRTSKAYNFAGQRKIYSLSGYWYWLTL